MRVLLIILLLMSAVAYGADSVMTGTSDTWDTYIWQLNAYNEPAAAPSTYNYGGNSGDVLFGHDATWDPEPERRAIICFRLPENIINCDSARFGFRTSEAVNETKTLDIFLMDTTRADDWYLYEGSSNGAAEAGKMSWAEFYGTDSTWDGADNYHYTTDTMYAGWQITTATDVDVDDSLKLNTRLVNNCLASANINYLNLLIRTRDSSAASTDYAGIYPSENATAAYRPFLTLYGVRTDTGHAIITGEDDVEDTYMDASGANTQLNYGGATTFIVYPQLFAEKRALVRCKNVDEYVPSGATIVACTLGLYGSGTGTANIDLRSVFKPWGEGALNGTNPSDAATGAGVATHTDWSNDDEEWGSSGCMSASDAGSDNSGDGTGYDRTLSTVGSITAPTTSLGWKLFAIDTSLANAWHDGTKNEEGVHINGTSNINFTFRSSEYTGTSTDPYWKFTYIIASEEEEESTVDYSGKVHSPDGLAPVHSPAGLTARSKP